MFARALRRCPLRPPLRAVDAKYQGVKVTPIEPDTGTDEWETWWLPRPVREWVEAIAAAYDVPVVMPIAAALCAASVVLQGKARVKISSNWIEELSLYWVLFAPTGARKSPVMRAALAPIRALQRSIEDELLPVIRERSNERSRLEAQIQRMRRATKAHKYTDGAQEHLQQLRELEHELGECEVPKVPEWLHTDCNPTVIPRIMAHNLEAEGVARIAVCDSEGTFLANLLGRHSGSLNADPLLLGYTGEPIEMTRMVQGSKEMAKYRLPSSHMVICMMVQPHYLEKLRAHPELADNGWMGRCIFSHVGKISAPRLNTPEIPDAVSQGYAAWLARLAAVPEGTVWEVPGELQSDVESLMKTVAEGRSSDEDAAGWRTRIIGRIFRIIALIALDDEADELMRSGPEGRAHEGIGKILTYLITPLYLRGLRHAQALEPARRTLPSHCRRLGAWLHRSSVSSGSHVTLRQVCQALRCTRDDGLAACDLMVEHGYLAMIDEKRRHNQTVTITYVVLAVPEPDGVDS